MYTEGVPHHTTPVNNQVHPIELALAIALSSIEALLWLINELLGFHSQPSQTTPQALQTAQTTSPDTFILSMTVKQLQAYTGIKSSRYNKQRLIEYALNN